MISICRIEKKMPLITLRPKGVPLQGSVQLLQVGVYEELVAEGSKTSAKRNSI